MAEREGAGRGIAERQRRGRSAGQLKGPLNTNLYFMSQRGEWGSRAGWGQPDSPFPRGGVSAPPCVVQDRHGPWMGLVGHCRHGEYTELRAALIKTERFHK